MKLLSALMLLTLASGCFAQKGHRVVIELTTGGTPAFAGVLDSIGNLRKAFAPSEVQVEVVCRGDALEMLLKHGAVSSRVLAAEKSGVDFAACGNTMKAQRVSKGELLPGVAIVPAGIAEVVLKQELGWSYLRE